MFARRQAEQHAADTERHENLQHKLALCAEVEALAQVDGEQLTQARARLHAIQQEWDHVGPIPKAEQKSVNQRFDAAIRQFDRHERTLRRVGVHETFQHLHSRSRLCAQLEAQLIAPAADSAILVTQAQREWQSSPSLPATLAELIQQRFDAVCQALANPVETPHPLRAKLEANLARKHIWCVCMEIVAGVESPPEDAQMRMEYQVARLSSSLTGATAKTDTLYEPRQLQEQWCLTGALPPTAEAKLDDRFLRAVRAWRQREDL